jgi:PAS domain S-box-containing protein
MDFEIWRPWARLVFLEPTGWEYALFVLEALLILSLLYTFRRDFFKLDRRGLLLLFACLLAPALTEHVAVVQFSGRNLLPPPGVPFAPPQPFAPLLGALPLAIAGAWLGPGAGLLVGLAKGVLRAGTATGGIADPFHLALFGFLVGFLLQQEYRGRLPLIARQPLVALPLMTPFAASLLLLSSFAHVADAGLSGFDYAVSLTTATLGSLFIESLVAATVIQAVYVSRPRLRPVRAAHRLPPYSRTLNRRFLFLFVPLIGLITVVLVYAVTSTALRLAISEAVQQMARDANSAADGIPYFIQTGQGLLSEYASDPELWDGDPDTLETRLRRDLRTVIFFDQFVLFDENGQRLAMYPPPPMGDPKLTPEERLLLERGFESGAPQISTVHRSARGMVVQSFLSPVNRDEATEGNDAPSRVLLGRTQLDVNPIIRRILKGLQWTNARGEGFVVNSEREIVAHPDASMLLTKHRGDGDGVRVSEALGGRAYRSRNPRDNTRELVYQLPVQGYPWTVVIRLPYAVVLEQARRIATPLLGLQLLLGGGLVIVISLATNWLTQPLQELATAADRIAKGDLSHRVDIPGADEVARVGDAFEDMRVRLRDRMGDLSLLLEVSQAVSSTLELQEGVPFILEGALHATQAQVAHIVLLSSDGNPYITMSRGEPHGNLRALDEALAKAARGVDRPLVIENLTRARSLAGSEGIDGSIKAVVALPIQTKKRVPAVMWIGYDTVRQFDDSEIDFLSTLAGQTAVLVENARLFQSAEGERRRLAAILASTTDAVLVTDRENRVHLINPAGERAFDVRNSQIADQKIDQSSLPASLIEIFDEPLGLGEALTRELSLPDGRTLYASVSAILSADGERLGRVAVMRDITHLKELDELKSDFVATVSHDLRSPLTFMRGYTTMLPTVGDLNQQQRQYVQRILRGISQMSNLVDDLLNLGRIEAGVGLERQPCHLGAVLAEAVDSMRARAAAEGITLRTEVKRQPSLGNDRVTSHGSDGVAIVSGDAALLRQAITNLMDNAIKYTPRGGMVKVELGVRTDERRGRAVVTVSDTGIGIAPEDQVRVFEKFYRVKRRDAPEVSGTGLGLAIVKSIVERHGGEVWVESELNEGCTFTISLPLKNSVPDD